MAKFRFNSKKAKKKLNLVEFKEDNLSRTAFFGAHIELFLNKEITVDGCKGVVDYTSDYIKLKIKKGYLCISGNSFYISYFENETLTATGNIISLEFII